MMAIIGNMTISTGGVLRLNKSLVERMDMKPGDRLIVLQDTEENKITIQVQRENNVLFLLRDAEIIKNDK